METSRSRGPRSPEDEGWDWRREARRMVGSLRLSDPRVARAMEAVPRHEFVPQGLRAQAYSDEPLPLAPGSTISAPHMVAFQAAWAEVRPGHHVLELGSGSGYLLAILAHLAGPTGRVLGIERDASLVGAARESLRRSGVADWTEVRRGDARGPFPDGEFHAIVASFSAPASVVLPWRSHLRPEGRLVVPLTTSRGTRMVRWSRVGSGYSQEEGPDCMFVPIQ